MITDVLAIVDLGSTDAGSISQAEHFTVVRGARLKIAVCAPVHAFEASLALAGGYALADDLGRCAKDKKADIEAHHISEIKTWEVVCADGDMDDLITELATMAHAVDITLVGPPEAYGDRAFRRHTVEHLALFSGRPVLTLPKHGVADRLEAAVIGWNGSREATRALNDALSLLDGAALIDIVTVSTGGMRIDLEQISQHVHRHGHLVRPHHLAGEHEAGDQLLAFARQSGASLLVLGAYGHNRISEFVLGGVTRELIEGASIPVLFSH